MTAASDEALTGTGLRIAILHTRWNADIIDHLLGAVRKTLGQCDVHKKDIAIRTIPGAYEFPLACKAMAETGRYDAVIALGCVIRGDTPHFDYVAGEAARGITDASTHSGIPVIFGVLTVNTYEQAEQRANPAKDNKGKEFAEAAIEMANLMKQIKETR